MFERLINYLKETRNELGKVNWPSRKEAINFTLLVIFVSLVLAIFMGFFDVLFAGLLRRFIL
jgi:preprotein translocase subunit SecE